MLRMDWCVRVGRRLRPVHAPLAHATVRANARVGGSGSAVLCAHGGAAVVKWTHGIVQTSMLTATRVRI